MTEQQQTRWQDIDPAYAADLDLSKRLDITAPLNEEGERCPWPWEPQQLGGAPMGQYHCPYCGAMVLAGIEHLDYAKTPEDKAIEFAIFHGVHQDDPLHVILDALRTLREGVESGKAEPWNAYEGDEESDPKVSREGYLGMLAMTKELIERHLGNSQPLPDWESYVEERRMMA